MPSVHSLRGLHFFSSWPESTAGQKDRSRSKGTALLRCTPPTQEDTHLAKRGHPRRLWVASTGSRFQRRCTSSSGIVAENCGVCSRPIVKLSGAKGGSLPSAHLSTLCQAPRKRYILLSVSANWYSSVVTQLTTFSAVSASTFIKISSASRLRKARLRDFLSLPGGNRILTALRTKMTQIIPVRKRGATERMATPYAKKDTNLAKRLRLTGFLRSGNVRVHALPTRFAN